MRFLQIKSQILAGASLLLVVGCGSGGDGVAGDAGPGDDGTTADYDAGPLCGNGAIDGDEVCDDGDDNSDAWSIAGHCNANCSGSAPYCGDSAIDGDDESCDEGDGNADAWSLEAHCNASCTGSAPYCGDSAVDSDNESCDDGADNSDAYQPDEHCNASCSGSAPLCNLVESPPAGAHPGVPYPPENLHTQEKALLGKILFWEQQLSADDTVACGTCHQASAGGSDGRSGQALHPGPDGLDETGDDVHGSMGIRRCEMVGGVATPLIDPVFGDKPQVTLRRAPSFLDAMFAPSLFWDGRAGSEFLDPDDNQIVAIAAGGALENQAMAPILSPVEMSCESRTLGEVYSKLEGAIPLALATNLPPDIANAICKYPSYSQLFASAFGDPQITGTRIAFAIATYERTLVSDDAPYDHFTSENIPDPNALTAAQQNGLALFTGSAGCADCHSLTKANAQAPAPFSNQLFHNLGFSDLSTQTNPDLGLFDITGLAEDEGKFKTPTMRNVSLREGTGLLHTGYGETLEDVMAAYNNPAVAPGAGSTTDPRMVPLNLSAGQIAEIVDFLRNGLTDPRVASESYPFDRPTLASD